MKKNVEMKQQEHHRQSTRLADYSAGAALNPRRCECIILATVANVATWRLQHARISASALESAADAGRTVEPNKHLSIINHDKVQGGKMPRHCRY